MNRTTCSSVAIQLACPWSSNNSRADAIVNGPDGPSCMYVVILAGPYGNGFIPQMGILVDIIFHFWADHINWSGPSDNVFCMLLTPEANGHKPNSRGLSFMWIWTGVSLVFEAHCLNPGLHSILNYRMGKPCLNRHWQQGPRSLRKGLQSIILNKVQRPWQYIMPFYQRHGRPKSRIG